MLFKLGPVPGCKTDADLHLTLFTEMFSPKFPAQKWWKCCWDGAVSDNQVVELCLHGDRIE